MTSTRSTGDIERAKRVAGERYLGAPVELSLGMDVSEFRPGLVLLHLPDPGDDLASGMVAPVGLSVLADCAGGVALSAYQLIGVSGPTVEFRVDYTGVSPRGAVRAESSVTDEVGGTGRAAVTILDSTDAVIARAQGYYVLVSDPPEAAEDPGTVPRPGVVEVLRAAVRAATDPTMVPVPVVRALANPRMQVHGGVLLAIGHLAQREVQLVDVDRAGALTPMSMRVDYLRPVPVDGGELSCRTDYVRRGRGFHTLRTSLVRADGKVATVVTGLWAVAR
ncbi:MAG TPA: acyl-CoA thioesterase domain-containing protein [Pseudonocardia sp.]|jgi:acyl-coenzyme A thioesterase PaaI-like protein